MISPPTSKNQLQLRAEELAGKRIGDLAKLFFANAPENLLIQKGWLGQFIESCLGADAGNESRPDFSHLDIELKTLPIDFSGKVLESTYVCVVNVSNHLGESWLNSSVRHKLSHVLWVPIAREPTQEVIDYQIATPFFWQPNDYQLALIRQDYEEAMEQVALGRLDQLNARLGEVMQVRPKAANSSVLTDSTDFEGNAAKTLPRGFYLRPGFTQKLLEENLKR